MPAGTELAKQNSQSWLHREHLITVLTRHLSRSLTPPARWWEKHSSHVDCACAGSPKPHTNTPFVHVAHMGFCLCFWQWHQEHWRLCHLQQSSVWLSGFSSTLKSVADKGRLESCCFLTSWIFFPQTSRERLSLISNATERPKKFVRCFQFHLSSIISELLMAFGRHNMGKQIHWADKVIMGRRSIGKLADC